MASTPPPPPTATPGGTAGVEIGGEEDMNGISVGGGGGGGGGGDSTQAACAVCRHQKRKCNPDCPLARYFPVARTQRFQDVHRLFGVSNLTRIQNRVDPGEQRDKAVATMIYEAEMRRRDPVHGACGVVRDLVAKVRAAQRELDLARRMIFLCRRCNKEPAQDRLDSMDLKRVGWKLEKTQ